MISSKPRRAVAIVSAAAVALAGTVYAAGGTPGDAATPPLTHPPVYTVVAAPTGTGTACTAAKPCSLGTAQATERRFVRSFPVDVRVVLDGGTYQLSHALRLTPADSGHDGTQVTYQAAPGAVPVLSGGRTVTGWQPAAGRPGVWQATIPAGFDTRQLYSNGHRLPLASGLPTGVEFVQNSDGFLLTSTKLDSWPDPSDLQVVFHGGNGPWTQTSCPVTGIKGLQLDVAQPCWKNLHLKALGVQELAWEDDPMGGFGGLGPTKSPTKLSNAVSLLKPGTWAIDHVSHTIYFEPKAGRDPAQLHVVAPALQTLLRVAGTRQHPVHDVTISGIEFAYGSWTAPDSANGFPQMQADWYLEGPQANNRQGTCQYSHPKGSCPFAAWTRTPANVVVTGAHRVSLLGNTFTHLGGVGLAVYNGSRHVVVKGNALTDISGTAIELGSTNDPLLKYVHGKSSYLDAYDTIADNYVHRAAIQYLGGIGIWLGYVQHARIVHNQIDHVPYTGISVGWGGWHGDLLSADSDDNISAHNVVADNLIYHYMLTLGDGGAIYTNGSQAQGWPTALHEHGNIAYYGFNTDFSLYTDAASKYIVLDHNFVYDQPIDSFDSGGCRTVGHIRLFDNWFSQGGPAYPCFAYTDVQQKNNATVCEDPTPAQAPMAIVKAAGLQPKYRHLITSQAPTVELVGPNGLTATGGDKVLISGSGYDRTATVRFGTTKARTVKVLSANYLLATAPAGSGTVAVTVTTSHGTSAVSKLASVAYKAKPGPCADYLGTNVTTKLFTG
jgi:hypothetical protein